MYSLRKLVWLAFLAAAVFLGIIMVFGARQYVLSRQYGALISQNEEALFRFSTIRESFTEAIIEDDYTRVEQLIPEIERLNASFSALQENPLIPHEFKLIFANQVDFGSLVIRIRRLAHSQSDGGERAALHGDMRSIADHLLKYDRLIVGQARSRMLNLQKVIIGSMGVMISSACFILIVLYKHNVLPLLNLSARLREGDFKSEDITDVKGSSREIAGLMESVRALAVQREEAGLEGEKNLESSYAVIAEKVNETTNQLNGIINYAQILADVGGGELTEQDREMLEKIIVSGTTIAQSWQQILREGQHDG